MPPLLIQEPVQHRPLKPTGRARQKENHGSQQNRFVILKVGAYLHNLASFGSLANLLSCKNPNKRSRANPLHRRNQQNMTRIDQVDFNFFTMWPYCFNWNSCSPILSRRGPSMLPLRLFSDSPASFIKSDQAKLRHVASSIRRPASSTRPCVFQSDLSPCKFHRPTAPGSEEGPLQTLCFGWFAKKISPFRRFMDTHPSPSKKPANIQAWIPLRWANRFQW